MLPSLALPEGGVGEIEEGEALSAQYYHLNYANRFIPIRVIAAPCVILSFRMRLWFGSILLCPCWAAAVPHLILLSIS